jgi:hypothetical protein
VVEALTIALAGSDHVPTDMLMAAWGQLLSWTVLGAVVLVAVAMVTLTPPVPVAAAVLGGALGAMATIMVGTTS